jgi:hypothetical protein
MQLRRRDKFSAALRKHGMRRMTDGLSIFIALSGGGAWLSKEIISKLLDRRFARLGRIGVIEGSARIRCDAHTKDGGCVAVDYFPDMGQYAQYSDCENFRLEIEFHLFNDTDTQIVLKKLVLEFWGVEGVRLNYPNPTPLISIDSGVWTQTHTIALPPHDVSKVRFEISVAHTFTETEGVIRRYYGESVLLLRTDTISGKSVAFRIRTSSFAGNRMIFWPPTKKYPIYNQYSLNKGGRKAGHRPQHREVIEDAKSQSQREAIAMN